MLFPHDLLVYFIFSFINKIITMMNIVIIRVKRPSIRVPENIQNMIPKNHENVKTTPGKVIPGGIEA